MRVEIEKIPYGYNNVDRNAQLYELIQVALLKKDLDSCFDALMSSMQGRFNYFAVGKGSSHIWVHELHWATGEIQKDRLLLITEKS